MAMTNSALATGEEGAAVKLIKQQVNSTIERIQETLKDNFKLKLEIAAEKKRYVDLLNAFLDVRNE